VSSSLFRETRAFIQLVFSPLRALGEFPRRPPLSALLAYSASKRLLDLRPKEVHLQEINDRNGPP